MKKFWEKNKVFISGAIFAAALASQEFMAKGGEFSWKIIGFAAFLAAISWLAKNLRAQAATITGVIGTALSTYVTMEQAGTISWNQIILQAVIAMAMAFFSSPSKPLEYEKTPLMVEAKEEVKEMKAEVKATEIKEEIKDLQAVIEPDPTLPKKDNGIQ